MKKFFLFFCVLFFSTSLLFPALKDTKKEEQQQSSKVFVPLPGMKEKIDTEDIIQKLLYVKQIPIEKKKLEIEDYKLENSISRDISGYIRNLDEKSKKLYDFQSPFKEMQGISPDENVIEVYATRRAKKEDYKVKINEIAQPDSFMSDSIEKNKILPPSEFKITIGKESVNVIFKGGTIYTLYEVLKNVAPDLLEARIVNDTSTTAILVLSGKKTGKDNRISISGNLETLLQIGMLTKSDEKKYEKNIYFDNIKVISGSPVVTKNAISLPPGTKVEKNISEDVKEGYLLSLDFEINLRDEKAPQKIFFTNGNGELVLMEAVKISNVEVGGGSLILDYEEKPKEIISNFFDYLTVYFTNGTKAVYQFSTNGNYVFSLDKFKNNNIEKVELENRNTDREVKIANFKIFARPEEEKFIPKNYITRASDADIELDGVEIKRDKNQIDDVIDGVTLNLKNKTESPITIRVDYDYKKIEDAILDWVNAYNQVMEYLYIVTEPNLDRTPLHQRSAENLKNGVFQTENSFISLKNKLRQIAGNSYKTRYEKELAVFEQMGIYTKKSGSFNANSEEWQSAKMGLLQVDLDKLKSVLKTKLEGVEELFANDLDGDLVKESGAAVSVNQSLRTALGNTGFIQMRIASNERKIKEVQKDVDEMNAKLADYELELRRKYGKMNQELSETEAKQKWLNNQFKYQQQQ
ncbi:MAG: flagellar filament capping protein FliD [Brevinematia bacterium]